jgi:hypothetical protein
MEWQQSGRLQGKLIGLYVILLEARFNPLTPELNTSGQACLTRYFTGDFAYLTVHFVNICVKIQQMQQLFIKFINYVWYLVHVSALHCVMSSAVVRTHHVTRHNTPIYNIL